MALLPVEWAGRSGREHDRQPGRADLGHSRLPRPFVVQRERALERLAARLIDGALTVTASEFRSQLRNREAAAARLAALVRRAIAAPPQARRATRPTTASVERRIAAKKRRGRLKHNRRSNVD